MYAVIETGGKQYKVSEGDNISIEKIDGKVGDSIKFDKILLLVNGDSVSIGRPFLGGDISGKILSQGRGEKIRVSKFKAKVRYRRTTGHRQYLTKIVIEKINSKKSAAKTKS